MSNAYPWLFSFGALVCLLWLGLVDPVSQRSGTPLSAITRIDAGLSALITGLLGARLGYVLVQFHFFSRYPEEILKFWNGGLTWLGGVIGAIVGLCLYAIISGNPFLRLADTIALPAVFLTAVIWFACMLDGCVYGKPSEYGIFSLPLEDVFGTKINRWPVQSAGAIYSLIVLSMLFRLQHQEVPEGVIASLTLGLISGGNLFLSFLRGDQVPIFNGLRTDAIASAALLILGIISLSYCARREKKL